MLASLSMPLASAERPPMNFIPIDDSPLSFRSSMRASSRVNRNVRSGVLEIH